MDNQYGPQLDFPDSLTDASDFAVDSPGQIGFDDDGEPTYSYPEVHISSNLTGEPMLVEFKPLGCGRITYANFHAISDSGLGGYAGHPGLYPQERVVLHGLMNLTECCSSPSF